MTTLHLNEPARQDEGGLMFLALTALPSNGCVPQEKSLLCQACFHVVTKAREAMQDQRPVVIVEWSPHGTLHNKIA